MVQVLSLTTYLALGSRVRWDALQLGNDVLMISSKINVFT